MLAGLAVSRRNGEHPIIALSARLFDRQPDQALRRQGHIPVLLELIHVFPGIEVRSIDLLLPGRGVGQCNQLDGFDTHGISS